jgi:undecaprenyl-phosphate 4-deoxy-4-formamido-L-arabinose transferase
MNFAKGDRIITIDDDLQTPPKEIAKLIDAQNQSGNELVYGIYKRKQHSVARNLGSKSLKTSAKALHNSYGEGSSFRLITAALVKKIIRHQQNFIFLDEVLLWYTDDIGFASVEHQPRKYDRSGYSMGKLFKLFANLVLYYTMVPLKLLVYGGLAISFVTFFYGLFFIFKKLVFDVPLGYTSLIVTILFSTSIILFSLGVLGEYLSRMYQIQNGKPPYSVKKVMEIEN